MSLFNEAYSIILDIKYKNEELKSMSEAWESDDPCAAAYSDPSDQYILGEEIEGLWKDLKNLINENID